jgi:hypothetical protein
MRSRHIVVSLAALLLPFVLIGCNNGAMTTNSGNPSSPGNPTDPNNPGGTGGSSAAVAYVYVSNETAASGPTQIQAYAADSNGQLTAVPGSPFNQNVYSLADNGAYLVATAPGPGVNTYTVGSNGALTLGPQFSFTQLSSSQSNIDTSCAGLGNLVFDRSGQSLYGYAANFDCANGAIVSFAFDSSNGSVSYLGDVNIGYESSGAIRLLGNDDYAYSAFSGPYWDILSLARNSNGLLVNDSAFTPGHLIAPPPGATLGVGPVGYTPGLTATDTANHVAMAEFPNFAMSGNAQSTQLAVYTADASGNLTTADTYATMPSTPISPLDIEASPSGTLLAVGGFGGLEIFHFNGASSITSFTGVLTTDNITQMAWDSSNHLYAITYTPPLSIAPGSLHVFNVTSSGATEAPGSPYSFTMPISLAVASQSQ